MDKVKMLTPIVEIDGDEMTRVVWQWIKEILIFPFVELKSEYYDLSLVNREATKDRITKDAAAAIDRLGVGVKCATITPNAQRMTEYSLTEMWKSPNGTIRAALDGTVFREPIMVKGISPLVPGWTSPIIIARHAYGDVYKDVEAICPKGSKAELVVTAEGEERRFLIADYDKCGGVALGMHNLDSSIRSFAKSCFNYALAKGLDLWFSSKDTISATYDHRFKDIFQEEFDQNYKLAFEEKRITYFYTLIDDAVARVMRSKGGFIWACKNYDGDVMSDMLATAFGSLAMMTSVLVSPTGKFEYEAAHGTVTRHYYRHLKGESTGTNPIATIFAWSGGLRKRGELDNIPELVRYADLLEKATIDTVEAGYMTGDLKVIFKKEGVDPVALTTTEFLRKIAERLEQAI